MRTDAMYYARLARRVEDIITERDPKRDETLVKVPAELLEQLRRTLEEVGGYVARSFPEDAAKNWPCIRTERPRGDNEEEVTS